MTERSVSITLKMENRRKTILEKAKMAFFKEGYYKTTLEKVAKSCGIAKGTLYLYFKNKKDLYISIIENEIFELVETLKDYENMPINPIEKLQSIIIALLNKVEIKREYSRIMEPERFLSDRELKREFKKRVVPLYMEIRKIFEVIIREAQKEKRIRNLPAGLVSRLIIGGIRSFVYSGEEEVSARELEKNFIEVYFYGILRND